MHVCIRAQVLRILRKYLDDGLDSECDEPMPGSSNEPVVDVDSGQETSCTGPSSLLYMISYTLFVYYKVLLRFLFVEHA